MKERYPLYGEFLGNDGKGHNLGHRNTGASHHQFSAFPASSSSTTGNILIIIIIIIIMYISGIIISIIIIIISGPTTISRNFSINISSHKKKDKKKRKTGTGSVKLWKLWNLEWLGWTTSENIFVKTMFYMQRTFISYQSSNI
ncbi:hypothetical protein ElyMa_002687500 [Elysia marginata]|uniref:Uncharacterized protein n=1 Tax=Elysia marginata TaxID=1093978 RepID=A0AAV4HF54_9GAST|nr:hypothetical protein ElyMa_002687500 [Elysia marginata]